MIGYGYDKVQLPDYKEMETVALAGTAAIAAETSDKTKFVAGQSSVLLCKFLYSLLKK